MQPATKNTLAAGMRRGVLPILSKKSWCTWSKLVWGDGSGITFKLKCGGHESSLIEEMLKIVSTAVETTLCLFPPVVLVPFSYSRLKKPLWLVSVLQT